ncbi:MAG: hypothetical protein MUF68_03505 [Cyclobacteriaceae bacterium]|nr:hypothetical protein [Cyclobacteriaceae bacterium]
MNKLDQLPKKDLFQAPEGYFDALPERIQKRVAKERTEPHWYLKPMWQIIVATVFLAMVGVLWFTNTQKQNAEELLASIETESLITYLAEEENLENILDAENLTEDDANALEENVFSETLLNQVDEDILKEIDINAL